MLRYILSSIAPIEQEVSGPIQSSELVTKVDLVLSEYDSPSCSSVVDLLLL